MKCLQIRLKLKNQERKAKFQNVTKQAQSDPACHFTPPCAVCLPGELFTLITALLYSVKMNKEEGNNSKERTDNWHSYKQNMKLAQKNRLKYKHGT